MNSSKIAVQRIKPFKERRATFLKKVREAHPDYSAGLIVLFAGFEHHKYRFRQESSFYYLTGIEEPGTVVTLDFSGRTTLYIPHCGNREQWMANTIRTNQDDAQALDVDEIKYLGAACRTYTFSPLFGADEYSNLLTVLRDVCGRKQPIFTLNPNNQHEYVEQRLVLCRLFSMAPELVNSIHDISSIIARMRRTKSKHELELLFKAVEITMVAQEGVAQMLEPHKKEQELAAGIEYVFAESGASVAFPSIVASGRWTTVLHYNLNNHTMKAGDLVVVDIGAEYNYYCADLTRTYPVNGVFSKRQKEVYNVVLETHEYIAQLAKPGMWLNNKEHQEQSLHHLAKAFLDKKGFGGYFPHGIGHYLGIDVHDVGSYAEPLQEGDVITIEPGIYIPQENIGIRLEDDYWITAKGAHCLSDQLPKDAQRIQEMAQGSLEEDEEE